MSNNEKDISFFIYKSVDFW